MARKPKTDLFEAAAEQPAAPPSALEAAPPPPPDSVKYRLENGGRWLVERYALLCSELPADRLGDGPEQCARRFHELVERTSARWWMLVQRLYGIMPLVPLEDADPDSLRILDRDELCALMEITPKQLQSELDTLRGVMLGLAELQPRAETPAPAQTESADAPALPFGDELLERFQFDPSMFDIKTRIERPDPDNPEQTVTHYESRDARLNKLEKDWFVTRLGQWRRLLEESMTSALARNALFNELQLRRIEAEMANLSPTAPAYEQLSRRRGAMETSFKQQLDAIEERFPEFGGTSGRISFKGCLHDVIRGWMEHEARGDNRLIDRVRTAAEVEVEMRQSVQRPEPQYRLGQSLYIGEAIAGLFDPHWQSQLKPGVLARLDRGMKEGINKAREERGEALVDLEADGAKGEFPELVEAKPATDGHGETRI